MSPRSTYNRRGLPAHCPNPKCRYHQGFHLRWPVKKQGFYWRQARPQRIQRYQCLACRRSFSTQTFATTYWLKQPERLRRIFMRTVGGMANRQIARDIQCAPQTVDRLLARLGRHCLLFHWLAWRQAPPTGPCIIDGFETFEFSQYYPCHFNLAVEADTGFFAYFTDSELRRKGRMTPTQKARRARLESVHGRPDPQAVRQGVRELLATVLAGSQPARLRSDDHRSYPLAIKSLPLEIQHEITPSKQRRDADNPLFEVNLLDLLIRHSSANHKRETIAWSKRRQAAAERLAIFLVWRNYIKRRWEKGPAQTPAMLKGLADRLLSVPELLSARIFRTRVSLPSSWARYYSRKVRTRALAVNCDHALVYAF